MFFKRVVNIFKAFLISSEIFKEHFTGFLFIADNKKSVSFFGSARENLPERYYAECEDLASRLSNRGFAVITGAGPGIMRAANRGAWKSGNPSVGVAIDLPFEQSVNKFLTKVRHYNFFSSRKAILSCASEIYIFFPGGYGTMDELFEMLTLVQTKHSITLPIVLYGRDFWEPLIKYIDSSLATKYKTINKEDVKIFEVFDNVDETVFYIDQLNLKDVRVCNLGSVRAKEHSKRRVKPNSLS